MAIFNSYVKLPEGNVLRHHPLWFHNLIPRGLIQGSVCNSTNARASGLHRVLSNEKQPVESVEIWKMDCLTYGWQNILDIWIALHVYCIFYMVSTWKYWKILENLGNLDRLWHRLAGGTGGGHRRWAPVSARLGVPHDRPPPQGVEVARARPQDAQDAQDAFSLVLSW
jgi:hypothetical protein